MIGNGNGHSHKCSCCESTIADDDDELSCDMCRSRCIKGACIGLTSAAVTCGSIQWRCPDCSKISTLSIFEQILLKMNKIDKLEKDVESLKSQNFTSKPETFANVAKLNKSCPSGIINPFRRNQRTDSTSSQVSVTRTEKRRRTSPVKVPVLVGTSAASTSIKGVKTSEREERRHYFLSRVSSTVDTTRLNDYCKEKNLTLLGCRELPSKRADMKSFHVVILVNESIVAEKAETWPENIIVRRYFLNEEARTWLKSLN